MGTNEDLTYGYIVSLDNTIARLRGLADRLNRDYRTVVSDSGQPQHAAAAASVVTEVTATLANLPLYNLIANAGHADAQWNSKPATPSTPADTRLYSVVLTEVNRNAIIATIKAIRVVSGRVNSGDYLTLKGAKDLVDTVRGSLAPGAVPMSPVVVLVGASREVADNAVRAIRATGSKAKLIGPGV